MLRQVPQAIPTADSTWGNVTYCFQSSMIGFFAFIKFWGYRTTSTPKEGLSLLPLREIFDHTNLVRDFKGRGKNFRLQMWADMPTWQLASPWKICNLEPRIKDGDKIMPRLNFILFLSSLGSLSLIPSARPMTCFSWSFQRAFSYSWGDAVEALLMVWLVWKCLYRSYITWCSLQWINMQGTHAPLSSSREEKY